MAKTTIKFNIVLEKDENGYFARCVELDGCFSQGETKREVLKNIQEATELYLSTMSEEELHKLDHPRVELDSIEIPIKSLAGA